ncbi:MAG TPA: FAD-dependent oxidoreductase [Steroidobacteraceae bacterium]|jgi:pyruvate/2-oxoglutarate dehydrogenase complex dihydrolipoamide dehydrogenase (E3) component|nr:FAD-dependent oxidoreductase [Steroidobacteraceae bacterium]
METPEYDLAIIGAGAAGLIAADFALQLGATVALLERERIGGDCTWTGCVPSKSLTKVASVAQQVRSAARYGLDTTAPVTDLTRVREYLRATIRHIYEPTAPQALREKGLAVHLGATRFLDSHTLETGGQRLRARRVLICTGAVPRRPALPGLEAVPYHTYQDIFENEHLPEALIVIGGGPVGCEIAQCYRRLGAQVTLVAERLLPRAEPEAAQRLAQVFAQEGIALVRSRATAVRSDGARALVRTAEGEVSSDLLLVAVGRVPRLDGLALEAAGVRHGPHGVEVDAWLRTSVRHIYAAGDVIGGAQFSHLAGWQGFQAVRNALLPGAARGIPEAVPEVTFTVPEVAHIGLTEQAARERYGAHVRASSFDLGRVDRAVSEDDARGLVKLIARPDGRLLGATIMGERAGEALAEMALALSGRLGLRDLAAAIHPYPTYNSAIQLLATQMALEQRFSGPGGWVLRGLSRMWMRL